MSLKTKKKVRFVINMLTIFVFANMLCACPAPSPDPDLPSLKISPISLKFTGQANITRTVNITTDADWSVNVQNVPWLTIDYASGSKNATVNFTTISENDTPDSRSADIFVKASNESGSVDSILHVEQASIYEPDVYAVISNEIGSKLEMAYGFGCRIKTGGNTSYFKYKVYEKNYYDSNIKGDKKKIEQELNNGIRITPQFNSADLLYKECDAQNNYVLALLPFSSSGNAGPLNEENIRTQSETRPALARISDVEIKNGKYVWKMTKENSCYDYFSYVYAGKSEIPIFKEDCEIEQNKRGTRLAWELSNVLAHDQEAHSTDIREDGRDYLFEASLNDGTLSFDVETTDRYVIIATWARNNNQKYSGIINEVLYRVNNGMLEPISEADRKALKDGEPIPPEPFNVTPTTLSFSVDGGEQKLTIKGDEQWSAQSGQSWCTLSKSSGTGPATTTVTVAKNTTSSSRSTKITFTAASGTKTVEVTQDPPTPPTPITVTPTSLSFSANAGTQNLTVTGDEQWSAQSGQSWCTLSKTSGTGPATITVAVSKNTASSSRSAQITFTAASGTKTVSVTQGAQSPIGRNDYDGDKNLDGGGTVTYTLSLSVSSLSTSPSGESKTVNVTSNDSWKVSSNQSWCTVSPSSGSNNGTVKITTAKNTTSRPRTATVTVKGTNSGKSETVTVSQDAYILSVNTSALSTSAAGETQNVSITSNDSWTVSSNQSWCTVSPSSGSSIGTVKITTAKNTTGSSRTATVTIKGTNSGISVTVKVTQGIGTNIGRNDYGSDKNIN